MFLRRSTAFIQKTFTRNIFIWAIIIGIVLGAGYHQLNLNMGMANTAKAVKKTSSRMTPRGQKPKVTMPVSQPQVTKVYRNNLPNSNLSSHPNSSGQAGLNFNDLPLLARIIHAEAGGEPLTGQVAVGAVIINRIKSGRFPRTIAANIFKPGEFESVANGYIWSNPTPLSYKAALLALKGWDPTYGSLYFFNPARTISRWIWSRHLVAVIGKHDFAG